LSSVTAGRHESFISDPISCPMFFTASESASNMPGSEKAHLPEIMKIEFPLRFFLPTKTGYFIFTSISRWIKSIRRYDGPDLGGKNRPHIGYDACGPPVNTPGKRKASERSDGSEPCGSLPWKRNTCIIISSLCSFCPTNNERSSRISRHIASRWRLSPPNL